MEPEGKIGAYRPKIEDFNFDLDASDKAGYSCKSFSATIKIVGSLFNFIKSSLGSIRSIIITRITSKTSRITSSFFNAKSIEAKPNNDEVNSTKELSEKDLKSIIGDEEFEEARLEQLNHDLIKMGVSEKEIKESKNLQTKLDEKEPKSTKPIKNSGKKEEVLENAKIEIDNIMPVAKNIQTGFYKGIANMNNSCTIASLLFSMFAASSFFDKLLLIDSKDNETRKQLRRIVNQLRTKDGFVCAEKLDKFRNLVMGTAVKGAFLQPDEFLMDLFKKLEINWENGDFCNFSISSDKMSNNNPIVELKDLMRNEKNYRIIMGKAFKKRDEFKNPIIEKKNNKVLFLNAPRQVAKKAFEAIIPSLHIEVEGQKYKLQSIIANQNDNHNVSYVISPKKGLDGEVYYFNGGGTGVPIVERKSKIYEQLRNNEKKKLDSDYEKLLKEGAFYIYIRE